MNFEIILISILLSEVLHFIIGVIIFINTGFDSPVDVNKSTVKLYKTFIIGDIICCFVWIAYSFKFYDSDKIKRWLRK